MTDEFNQDHVRIPDICTVSNLCVEKPLYNLSLLLHVILALTWT